MEPFPDAEKGRWCGMFRLAPQGTLKRVFQAEMKGAGPELEAM